VSRVAGPPRRVGSIDAFRGLAVALMVVVNYLADVETVPTFLKHSGGDGLRIADLVAPAFVLAIGLTYGPSFRRRRERDGLGRTVAHFLRRWLALIGIGALISAGEILTRATGVVPGWGVLQALGVAGLLTLPALSLKPAARLGVGLALLALYQFILDRFLLEGVLTSVHGGLWGAVSWTAFLILATWVGDLFHGRRGDWYVPLAAIAAVAAGLLLTLWVPPAKDRVSASYVLMSLGIGAGVFWLVHLPCDRAGLRLKPLEAWGRNPLLLYVLHLVLLAGFVLPAVPWWHVRASAGLILVQLAALLAALGGIAWLLYRRGIVVSL
jgi:predicted acyltransferase